MGSPERQIQRDGKLVSVCLGTERGAGGWGADGADEGYVLHRWFRYSSFFMRIVTVF